MFNSFNSLSINIRSHSDINKINTIQNEINNTKIAENSKNSKTVESTSQLRPVNIVNRLAPNPQQKPQRVIKMNL